MTEAPTITLEQLGLPPSVLELTKLKRGLVLVTGATGQGSRPPSPRCSTA